MSVVSFLAHKAESTPEEATPDEATPGEATPEEATPDEATPEEALNGKPVCRRKHTRRWGNISDVQYFGFGFDDSFRP